MSNTDEINFGLTEAEFHELRDKLEQGDEALFEVVFLSHFEKCYEYVIQEDNASPNQSYDATMEAFYSFRTKIAEGKIKYGNLRFLLTRMARQHFYKSLRRKSPVSLDLIQETPESIHVSFEEETFELLRKAWATLGQSCKELLHAFYYGEQTLKDISASTGQKYVTLRKRKQRCMDKLKTFMRVAEPNS